MKFATHTLVLVLLGVTALVVGLVVASRYFDAETIVFMGAAIALVAFFGSMPVLLGALARRKNDR